MEHIEGTFESTRELRIYYQAWLPDGDCKAAIIIVHGLGEHSGRYGNVVNYLVPLGYAIYGFDLPGHGKSEGDREFVRGFEDYTETLMMYRDKVKAWHPGKPIFLVGHSMGGLITTYYLLDHSSDFSGAVISAPAITVPENITKVTIMVSKVLSKIAPKLGMMQLDANDISRDTQVVQDYLDDPLVFNGKTPVRLMTEMLKGMLRINEEVEKITVPFIAVQGSEDKLANPEGAKMLYERAGSKDKTLKIYDGLYHEVFNEPERDQVLGDVEAWLDERV